jgi:hypothetical protein
MMILINSFSANMLAEFPASVTITEIDAGLALVYLLTSAEDGEADINSAVGHADTASVLSEVLGIPVPCERKTVTLRPGDTAIIGQYSGPRLPEGCRILPEGATIKWLLVQIGMK